MKQISRYTFALCLAAGIIVVACKKSNYNDAGTSTSLNQVFAGLRPTPQGLTVAAGRDTVMYGANGTMLHFYTNSFKDANGNIITSGTVYVQLTEMYKPGDMICNRATTMANGQILQSGGQINLVATMSGGQVVYANKYGIGFKHGNASQAPMALFYGASGNSESVTTWTQSDTTQKGTMANGTFQDSTRTYTPPYGGTLFVFDSCPNFNWANCDWFYNSDSPKTTVNIILPDTSFNPTNTQLFLVLHVINHWGSANDTTIAVLSDAEDNGLGTASYTAATHTMALISEGNTAIVPSGMKYELVAITNKKGAYYYFEQSGTIPHGGLIATATMGSETQGDIIARLAGL